MLAKQLNDAVLSALLKLAEILCDYAHTFNVQFADSDLWAKHGKPYTWKLQEITNDLIILYDYSYGMMAVISLTDNKVSIGKHMIVLNDYVILCHEYYGTQSSIFKRVN